MNNGKFLEICKNVIKPLLDHITKDDHIKAIYDISEESKALNLKSHYDMIKDRIKTDFMQDPNGRIETYLTQTLQELCHAQKHNELSVLMLANIFSTIESFSESVYKNTLAAPCP